MTRWVNIGSCTELNSLSRESHHRSSVFEQNRRQCSSAKPSPSENANAFFKKTAQSKHKFDDNLLCVPIEYSSGDVVYSNRMTGEFQKYLYKSMYLTKCGCR